MKLERRVMPEDVHLPADVPPLLQRIYALRGIRHADELQRSAQHLLPWQSLKGIQPAVAALSDALERQQRIVIVGDFDADGATSTALMVLALRRMGAASVQFLVPSRFDDGYGLTPGVVRQAAAQGAELIITVDNGISSLAGVEEATRCGIPVIITDHHLPGSTLPAAQAIVNPNQPGCPFPSKTLAGVGVAFYVMLALRAHLRDSGWFSRQAIPVPALAELLDLVALGTVADVVPLDKNNRILVHQGLSRIRAGYCRPGIQALLEFARRNRQQLSATDLGFVLGPRLNAAGRLDDMSVGVTLLLCDDPAQARALASDLDDLNQTRKAIEQEMQAEALALCNTLLQNGDPLPKGLVIYHPQWHQGVIGIVASRLKERFHRPVIAFAPGDNGQLKGSGRSIAGLHLRDVLERLDTLWPGMIVKFGGHAMAAGLTLPESQLTLFQQRFNEVVSDWLDDTALQGVILTDGPLAPQEMTLESAELLRQGGPWGQGFPEPVFDGRFRLLQQRRVGERHLKVLVEPCGGGPLLDGIAFNVDTQLWPDPSVQEAVLAYRLEANEFRGQRNVQLLIEQIWPG